MNINGWLFDGRHFSPIPVFSFSPGTSIISTFITYVIFYAVLYLPVPCAVGYCLVPTAAGGPINKPTLGIPVLAQTVPNSSLLTF